MSAYIVLSQLALLILKLQLIKFSYENGSCIAEKIRNELSITRILISFVDRYQNCFRLLAKVQLFQMLLSISRNNILN